MDTLSRDSNKSGSILPLVGVIAGGLALVLAAVALFKLSTIQKSVATQIEEGTAKIASIETEVRNASAKSESDLRNLGNNIQTTFNSVGTTIGEINAKIAKIEEAQKARAVAPAGKGGAPAAVTGKVDANGNYIVAPGDSLTKIAKKFATSVDRIEAENPGLNAKSMKVGQKVKIPKK
jgi:LysM repeat protein